MKKLIIAIFLISSFTSCDVLQQLGSMALQQPLNSTDVATGLKQALSIGVDSAVHRLSNEGGYYLEEKVRIHLPPEADLIVNNASKIPAIKSLIDEMELKLNRSAEDAAVLAAPIFASAIKEMSINDAWGILNGSDTAAVHYLRQQTDAKLFETFKPHVDNSLKKPLVANLSAHDSWQKITSKWNGFAGSFAGKLLSLKTVNTDLSEYVTRRALEGLYIRVGEQEKEIRTNANARVNDLLKRVFGEEGKRQKTAPRTI